MTAMPYIGQWGMSIIVSIIADTVLRKGLMPATAIRKAVVIFSKLIGLGTVVVI